MNHLERMSALKQYDLIYVVMPGAGPMWTFVADDQGLDIDGDLFCMAVEPVTSHYVSDCIYVNETNIISVFNDTIDALTMM